MTPRYLILADGAFGPFTSKTAVGCIRFTPEQVVAVLDTVNAGRTVQDVLGFGGDIPVVASVAEGLTLQPNVLLIGIAPAGGRLPEAWRPVLRAALDSGLHVWSGLHVFIGDDPSSRCEGTCRSWTCGSRRPTCPSRRAVCVMWMPRSSSPSAAIATSAR